MRRDIAISGTIGAGKSTLVSYLTENRAPGVIPLREPVADNPYLEDFYLDPVRWAFSAQVFMISHRFNAACRQAHHPESSSTAVLDRCFHEDKVFALVNYRLGNISERDWLTYQNLYDSFCSVVPLPEVIVYLRLDPQLAQERIQGRGRQEEQSISLEYLSRLHEAYEDWIHQVHEHSQGHPQGARGPTRGPRVLVVDAARPKGEVCSHVAQEQQGQQAAGTVSVRCPAPLPGR